MGGRGGETTSSGGQPEAAPLEFEWDPAKSAANKVKHGVDFEEAKVIWQDPKRAVIKSKHEGEPRQLVIAPLNGRMRTAIITMRGNVIRIISVRRSWNRGEAYYARRGLD
ncbi:MAG: BrnT family toxin [Bifidobacteriaceae bacterium]|nr:BrnT family toxin [Bifidobacteriaceae bacterium]